jgi:hypothetical protein
LNRAIACGKPVENYEVFHKVFLLRYISALRTGTFAQLFPRKLLVFHRQLKIKPRF